MGLELLHRLWRIVDQREACRLTATELCSQAEDVDLIFLRLVHASQLVAEFVLGDVRSVRVENVPRRVDTLSAVVFCIGQGDALLVASTKQRKENDWHSHVRGGFNCH